MSMLHSKEVGQALGLQFSQISTVFAAKVTIEHDKLTRMLHDAVAQMGPGTNLRTNGKLRGMIQLGEERLLAVSDFVRQHRQQYGLESDADRIERILAAAERLDSAITDAKNASNANRFEQQRAVRGGEVHGSPSRYADQMGVPWNRSAPRGTLSPPLDSSPLANEPGHAHGHGGPQRPRGFLRDPMEDDLGRPSVAFGSGGAPAGNMRGAALHAAFGMAGRPQSTFDDIPVGGRAGGDRTPPRSTRSGNAGAYNSNVASSYDDQPVRAAAPQRSNAQSFDDVPIGTRSNAPQSFDDMPIKTRGNPTVPLDELPVGPAASRRGMALGAESKGSDPPSRAGAPPSRFQRPAAAAVVDVPVTIAEAPKRGPPAALRARLEARTAQAAAMTANAVVHLNEVAAGPGASAQSSRSASAAAEPASEAPRAHHADELPPTSNFAPAPVAAATRAAAAPPRTVRGVVSHSATAGSSAGVAMLTSRFYVAPRRQGVTLQTLEDVVDFEAECRTELFAAARAQLLEVVASAMNDAFLWHRRASQQAVAAGGGYDRADKPRQGRLTVTPSRSEYSIWSFVVVAPILLMMGAFVILPLYNAMRKVVGVI